MNEHRVRSRVGTAASTRHGLFAAIVTFCMIAAALYSTDYAIGRYWSAVAFSVIALISLAGHACINALLRRAREAERLEIDPRPIQRWVRIGTVVCQVVAVAVIPICLLPVILVETQDWTRIRFSDAEVVSPGDKVKLEREGSYIPREPQMIDLVNATVTNADELGDLPKPRLWLFTRLVGRYATDRDDISVPGHYFVQVEVPNDPRWAGQTIRARWDMELQIVSKEVLPKTLDSVSVEIPVAPEGAGPMYRNSWWVAVLGGAFPAALVGFVLGGLAGTPRPKQIATPSDSSLQSVSS